LSEVRNYYGFAKDLTQAGYFETEQAQRIIKELSYEIRTGKLITISRIVGCGKTVMLRRVQEILAREREILVAQSLSVEKSQISLPVLMNALFYDLATEKDFKIPTQPEKREPRSALQTPALKRNHFSHSVDLRVVCSKPNRGANIFLARAGDIGHREHLARSSSCICPPKISRMRLEQNR
jgi:type II secretory pathway predicted ATPase ExeA